MPATVITILDGGVGTLDGFLSATDGTITAADNPGVVGSISRAALQAVNANVNISITAEDAIVINTLTSPLSLKTGAGNSVTFASNTTSVIFSDVTNSLSTAGGDVIFTATTDMTIGGIAANGGKVQFSSGKSMAISGPVATTGTGTISVNANTTNTGGNGLTTSAGGSLSTDKGKIGVSSHALMTIGATVSSTGGGNISIEISSSVAVTTLNINAPVTATGGDGSIQLSSPDHLTVIAPVSAVGSGGIFINADTDKLAGGVLSNSAAGTLTTAGGVVDVTATDVSLLGAISAGAGLVILETQIAGTKIHIGTNAAFGVSDAELALITADVVHIGGLANTAGIIIDGPVTRHAGFDTLTLQTDGNVSQTASLSVAELAAQASSGDMILTNAANNVDFIAGTGNNSFIYTDVDGFEVAGVDIRAGIFLGGGGTGDLVILTAGGSVTQEKNEIIHVDNLLFLGTGSFNVSDTGNDVETFAASVTGSVIYTDSNSLKIGSVSGIDGVTTSTTAITITASAQVSDTTLTVNKAIASGGAAVTLNADILTLNTTVSAGGGVATLAPTTVGRGIDLGTNPSAGKLGVTQADLDIVTGGAIVVGSATAGDLSITQQITPTTTNRLDLVTGGQIIDAHGGTDLVVTNLVLKAGTGIGISAPNFELDTTIDKLEASTTTGGIVISEADALQIGGVSGLNGVSVVTSGNISITANGTISLAATAGLQVIGGGSASGDITLNAFGANSDVTSTADGDAISGPAGSVTVNASRDILFGTAGADFDNDVRASKDLKFEAGRDITIDGFSDIAADDFGNATGGNVLFTAGRDINITDAKGSDASVGNSGAAGSVTFSAVNDVTLHALVFSNGAGQVSITYDSDNDFAGVFTSAANGTISTDGGSIGVHGGADNKHGGLATIGANVTITGGSGSITADSAGAVNVNAALSVTGTGGIFITADSNVNGTGDFNNVVAGTLTTAGGVISITANDVAIGGAINATTASFADVFLQPSTNGVVIHLGTNVGFGVADAEADLISASALIIGAGSNTGGIQLTGQVSLDPTKVKTLELLTAGAGGAITDNTAGEQADISVQDLLLIADSGVGVSSGAPGDLDINVTNLAVRNNNATAGAINLFNSSPSLNITGAGTGFFTAFGVLNSNATAATGPVSVRTLGDLTIKSSIQAGGANNVVLQAADDLTVEAAGSLKAGGTVSAFIDFGNADAGKGATATIAGKVTATSMSIVGNADSDTFNITPSATTPISVDGDNPIPPTLPGDTLNVDVTGTTGLALNRNTSASGLFGDYQFTNRAKVSFQHIETLSPDAVDLSVLMSDSPDPVAPGGKITYTIAVNIGDSDGQNVQLSDILPSNTTFVSFTAPPAWIVATPPVGGTGSVTATRTTLAGNSAAQVFTLVVHVNGSTPNSTLVLNTAKVDSSTIELNPGNNLAAATTTVRQAVLPVVVGADAGGGSHVKVYDPVTGMLTKSFFAYNGNFKGGVRVAAGDINGDGVADVITGAGPGGGPHVKVFDGASGAEIRSFYAYTAKFMGGVFVAAGDVNEDGYADIITGADAGGGPHVEVFSGLDGSLLASYYAYASDFSGGVRVAAGDVNGDGKADIITGAGPGGGPHVTARSGSDLSLLRNFFAYDSSVKSGVYVASGDLNNDGKADIITGAGQGSVSHSIVYSGADNKILQSFVAYNSGFTGGVRVSVADFGGDGQLDLITGAGPGGGPHVRVFQGDTLAEKASFFAFDPSFMGGVFVG